MKVPEPLDVLSDIADRLIKLEDRVDELEEAVSALRESTAPRVEYWPGPADGF